MESSVIARLMGLDERPPPKEPVQKPQRVLSENYLQRVASIGVGKRCSFRTTLEEKKPIKDVCQVVKICERDGTVEPSIGKGKGNFGLSVNKKPQTSKQFQGSLGLVDSTNGYFQIYIPKRNSSLSKPIHGLQSSLPFTNRISTSIRRNVGPHSKPKGTKPKLGRLSPCQILENSSSVTGSCREEFGQSFHKFAKLQLVTEDKACSADTRIVVLKPTPVESETSGRYFSSPSSEEDSHSGDSRCEKFSGSENGRVHVEGMEKKILVSDAESVRQKSIATREILEGLSRRTRWRKTSFSTKVSSLGFRSDENFEMKPKLLTPHSSCSSEWSKRYQSVFSSDKSLTNIAKTHLSERHAMTQRFEQVIPPSKGSALDEFLAMQGHDSRPQDYKRSIRRHGLKDLDLSKFSKTQSKNEAFQNKWHLRPDKSVDWARHKRWKHNSGQEEGSEAKELKWLDSNGSYSLGCSISSSDVEDEENLQETWVGKDHTKNKPDDCNIYGQNLMLPKPPTTSANSETMAEDSETKVATDPSGKSENGKMGLMACSLLEEDDDDSSSHTTDTSFQQVSSIGFHEESSGSLSSGTELDSLVGLEDVYQPSPISVLELQFSEETINNSEFLGKVTDDICDLSRHLELLQSEASESYSDGPGMAVSSDEESEEASAGDSKENIKIFRVEECRNFSYLVDVLAEVNLHGRNLDEFSTWQSLHCPISLSIFEILEKKYGHQTSWKRSERRLLFDRVNEGLMKIILPCTGLPSRESSVSRRLRVVLDEEMIQEDLWRLLVSQDKECSKSSVESVIGSELGKVELGDEIDAIGIEIETLLVDELMQEFFLAW